jgi:1-acyl-sn-glycerol-3-phosphate acyltransferase
VHEEVDAILHPSVTTTPRRQQVIRSALDTVTRAVAPVVALSRPWVSGSADLPEDGRFLLVGNHTRGGGEVFLIPFFVQEAIGTRVRPLADKQFARMRGLQADLVSAYGAVVGTPEATRDLMRDGETILVFPGGAREVGKFKGEEYTLRWENRFGFARLAVEHGYPIVTAALVGGDDVYAAMVRRDSLLGRATEWGSHRLSGRSDMVMPPMRGIGPTLVPRPRRMYLAFGQSIDTTTPRGVADEEWATQIKQRVERELAESLSELQGIQAADPYRNLNPLAWRSAATP